jgi:hypothetical protein
VDRSSPFVAVISDVPLIVPAAPSLEICNAGCMTTAQSHKPAGLADELNAVGYLPDTGLATTARLQDMRRRGK